MRRTNSAARLAVLVFAIGCSDSREAGTLEIRIYGEDYIEGEIPAADFIDGWSVQFDRFLVSVGELRVAAGPDSPPGLEEARHYVFDLAQPSSGAGHTLVSAQVEGGVYDHLDYRIGPEAGAVTGNVDAASLEVMRSGGLAVLAEGVAVKGGSELGFSWRFDLATGYRDCESQAEVDGGEGAIEITIHGDHLFYDDLVSHQPSLAFDLIAEADVQGDGDGEVSKAELVALDITTRERYQVGSLEIDNLWDYLEYASTTIGHVDGEGHCHAAVD